MLPRNLRPIRLSRRPRPFNSTDWIFEVKFDGFRSLAHLEEGRCELISRNGNTFKTFPQLSSALPNQLAVANAVIDGEIVCLDDYGRSVFNDLLFHRGHPFFYVFDLLFLNGEDLRELPLMHRKARLRSIVPRESSHILYLDHIETEGVALFEHACALDLEGIVAKRKDSRYRATEKPSPNWVKIKNANYTQTEGRAELFERSVAATRAHN
jgi:bifunctional non-homologous end joining protein LigD